jgi:hypothetical protein
MGTHQNRMGIEYLSVVKVVLKHGTGYFDGTCAVYAGLNQLSDATHNLFRCHTGESLIDFISRCGGGGKKNQKYYNPDLFHHAFLSRYLLYNDR